MNKVAARSLRPWESHKLHQMKRQWSNGVNRLHARIILLSVGKVGNAQIAEKVGCTATWVRTLIHRFNDGGIDAITYYPYLRSRPGPRKFLAEITEQICEVALSSPKPLIGLTVWSLPSLREYLIAQKIVEAISIEHLRQILRTRKVRWRHTKTWKGSDDPLFWPKSRRIRRLYKGGRPAGGRRLSIDEFGPLSLLPRHGKHYARTGHVDRLRATYSRKGGVRFMYGVYDLETDTLIGRFVKRKNRRTFLAFLQWLWARYPRRQMLHIVLDNATFHDRPRILAYAATHRVKFYFTPTAASWPNRIESHFTALRKFALDNTDYHSHPEMQKAIHRYLRWRNGERQISSRSWKTYKLHPSDSQTYRKTG